MASAGGELDLAPWGTLPPADDELHARAHLLQLYAHVREHLRRHAVALPHESQQYVFGAYVVVLQSGSFHEREAHCPFRAVGERSQIRDIFPVEIWFVGWLLFHIEQLF